MGLSILGGMKNILFALVLPFIVVGCGTSNSNPPEQSKEPEYPIAGRWQADLTSTLEDVDWEELGMEPPEAPIVTIEVIDSSTLRITNSEDQQPNDVAVLYDNEENTIGSFLDPTNKEKVNFSILGNETLRMLDIELNRIE